jgi:Raf kinase inhibitor-like YbhB/YbcL family protein
MFTISLPAYANVFTLSTPAFAHEGTIPIQYSCDGKDISPALEWAHVPEKTKTLALILSDPDAPGGIFYHWAVFNIPNTMTSFPEAVSKLPAGTMVGKNSWGQTHYRGPCPPKGATHHYIFSLYALDASLALPADIDAKLIINAFHNHLVGKAELKALFAH